MPLPRQLGRINRRVTNPILWPIVARLPRSGFGRVVHVGRRTGRVYRTPMLGFRHGDGLVFALTYGQRTQWVQNVIAAGACTSRRAARHATSSNPASSTTRLADSCRASFARSSASSGRTTSSSCASRRRPRSEERENDGRVTTTPSPTRQSR